MILQELCRYYDRKLMRGEIAPDGYIPRNIDFIIKLNDLGKDAKLQDRREPIGKRMQGTSFNVPAIGKQAQKHNNAGNDANLLWDNCGFVLGIGKKGDKKLRSFIDTIRRYYPAPPSDISAVLAFLEDDEEREALSAKAIASTIYGKEIESGAPLVTFRVAGGAVIIEEAHVRDAMANRIDDDEKKGTCLVTGRKYVPIALTHSVVKGIAGGQSTGCNLVSFNAPSFCSYGLEQSFNASTSVAAANSYTKALQFLIDSKDNMVRIADATVVNWVDCEDDPNVKEFEAAFGGMVSDPAKDNPDEGVTRVKALLESVKTGRYMEAKGNFYVLGLSPNSARLSVRYWEMGPVRDYAKKIAQHFKDFEIVHTEGDYEHLSLPQILRATALEYKISNVPANMAGEVMRSILSGRPYPHSLFGANIRRIRAERNVSRTRAAILKACINREIRCNKPNDKEVRSIDMSLDKENMDIGYRLGRLFAALEKIQEDALGKLNAGIRDRYYGAASSTPVTVFSRLLQLKNHHMAKLDPGLAVVRERSIGEIMDGIDCFPSHLTLNQQGNFAIGYYHQRQDFFTKQSKN